MALKISNDIERIGDYATNIAKRIKRINVHEPLKPFITIPLMAQICRGMVKDVLDAYIERDVDKALEVWRRDPEVDEYYNQLFRELLTYILEDPKLTGICIDLMFVAKNLERIGDHATNIAEKVYYIVHGDQLQPRPERHAVKPLILVVEDEPPLQKLLAYNLEAAGFAVVQAFDGEEAMTLIEERLPDLLLLDWMLPQLSGLEVCRRLRRRADTAHLPIIMLTARGEEPDRLRGLDTGADDFISKPFSPAELIARVRAVLRRVRPAFAEQLLSFHDLRLDLAAHRVHRGEREIHLSPTEFRLLRHFLEHPGPGLQPRPAARPGLGLGPRDRAAHRRRHHPPPAPGAQCRAASPTCCARCARRATRSTTSSRACRPRPSGRPTSPNGAPPAPEPYRIVTGRLAAVPA